MFNRVFKRSLSLKVHETKGDLLDHVVGEDFSISPKPQQRVYIYASVLAFMLRSHEAGTNWHMTFKTQAKKLDVRLKASDGTDIVSRERNMGFPAGWEHLRLWSAT